MPPDARRITTKPASSDTAQLGARAQRLWMNWTSALTSTASTKAITNGIRIDARKCSSAIAAATAVMIWATPRLRVVTGRSRLEIEPDAAAARRRQVVLSEQFLGLAHRLLHNRPAPALAAPREAVR